MKWTIQRICPKEESVFLVNPDTGTTRQISVPGAEEAWFDNDILMIRASNGYLWAVEPETGARRRIIRQQDLI